MLKLENVSNQLKQFDSNTWAKFKNIYSVNSFGVNTTLSIKFTSFILWMTDLICFRPKFLQKSVKQYILRSSE